MFVTVKYGDNKEQLVSIICKNVVLLQFIKNKSGCSNEEVVELADERGHVKNLRRFPENYASQYLKNRETLVLLKVTNERASTSFGKAVIPLLRTVYTPLLLSLASDSDFNATLNPPRSEDVISEIISFKSSKTKSFTFGRDEFRKARSKSRRSLSGTSQRATARRGRKT